MTCSGGLYFGGLGSTLTVDGACSVFLGLKSWMFLNGFLT